MCQREKNVQFLNAEWERANAWLTQLKFDSTNKSELLGAGLAANAIEIGYSMLCLFASDSDAAQMPLLRTLIEAGYKYLYLAKAPNTNVEILELEDLIERLKLMNGPCEIVLSAEASQEKKQLKIAKLSWSKVR
jgi:hypothetical protein